MSDDAPTLRERVRDMEGWARSRIRHCRGIESRFAPHSVYASIIASERRALESVLEQLGLKPEPTP
jgi:hypothetical protein